MVVGGQQISVMNDASGWVRSDSAGDRTETTVMKAARGTEVNWSTINLTVWQTVG